MNAPPPAHLRLRPAAIRAVGFAARARYVIPVSAALLLGLTPALAQAAPSRAGGGVQWTADWIGRPNPGTWPELDEQNPAPLLRKEFTLGKKIARARLAIAGLGLYEAWINGERVGNQVLDPAPSQYDMTSYYRTFDVTASPA